MDSDIYKNYLRDLIFLIKERSSEHKNMEPTEFQSGVSHSYYEILEMIQNQASAFQLELDDIGFDDFEKSSNRKDEG